MPVTSAAAVWLAALLDLVVAEPPARVHPVALFGRLVAPLDRGWSQPVLVGVVGALVLPLVAATAVGWLVWLAFLVHPAAAVAVAALVLFSATSLRLLLTEARTVASLSATDLPAARERLRSLAGRDAADLSAGQVRSAVVESLGENLADGLVGPLFAFTVVAAALAGLLPSPSPLASAASLSFGAGAAAWVKAVNTMDSMLGYRSKPVGWAAARLDDLAMWVPARVTAVLLAATALAPRALLRARRWTAAPPSPNSGWPMATLSAALPARLAKPGSYDLNPNAALPTVPDAERAGVVVGRAGLLAFVLAGVVVWF